METFPALLALLAGNSPVTGEFPSQRPVIRSFDVFFDLRLNKRLSEQLWSWCIETPSRPLWRHHNVLNQGNVTTPLLVIFTTLPHAYRWVKSHPCLQPCYWYQGTTTKNARLVHTKFLLTLMRRTCHCDCDTKTSIIWNKFQLFTCVHFDITLNV